MMSNLRPAEAGTRQSRPTLDENLNKAAAACQDEDERRGLILHDVQLDAYLQTVVQRLWRQTNGDMSLPRVRVLLNPHPVAHAFPNGICDLSTGMLALLRNEDQLALVLAHEMVHYFRRHALQAYSDPTHALTGSFHPSSLKYAASDRGDNRTDFMEAAERQADEEGLALAQKAGYRCYEIYDLLEQCRIAIGGKGNTAIAKRLTYIKPLIQPPNNKSNHAAVSAADDRTFLIGIAPALLADARVALKKGYWDQARTSSIRYLEVRPLDAGGYVALGDAHLNNPTGDFVERAVEAYSKAIEVDGGCADAYRALGFVYYKAGRRREARIFFENSLSLAPNHLENTYVQEYLQTCMHVSDQGRQKTAGR